MIKCWCDGGIQNNGKENSYGGWGAIIEFPDGTREVGMGYDAPATNNTMEMSGAIFALEYLRDTLKYPLGTEVTLTSDSQYLVNGASSWMYTWQKKSWRRVHKAQLVEIANKDLWLRIWELSLHFEIDWKWVKGHSGHAENELCDQMATEAMAEYKKLHLSA